MCGIIGYCGPEDWRSKALLQELLIQDEERGKDSTGVAILTPDGMIRFNKRAIRGREFVAQGYTALLFKHPFTLALGHNRAASSGAVNDKNSHPFAVKVGEGYNLGIHNGTVGVKTDLAQRYGFKEPEVDSKSVFMAISTLENRGINTYDAIEEVTEFISGHADFAFIYMDTARKRFLMWRSENRPMIIVDARELNLGRWICSTNAIFEKSCNPSLYTA